MICIALKLRGLPWPTQPVRRQCFLPSGGFTLSDRSPFLLKYSTLYTIYIPLYKQLFPLSTLYIMHFIVNDKYHSNQTNLSPYSFSPIVE